MIGALATVATLAAWAGMPPNILWIVSDDHSWRHAAVYGDPNARTPNLDRLAGQGMRLNRAYVMSPQCLPSRASLMTGRGPVAIGMTRFTAALPAECVMFPEVLRQRGYFTALAGRPHHLQGWSYTTNIPPLYAKLGLLTVSNRFDFVRESNHGTAESRRDEFFQQLDEFFAAAPRGKPFFLQFGLLDPHRAFSDTNANPYGRQYDPARLTLAPDFPDTPAVRADLALYYGMVSRMDHDVGRVLKALDDRGMATNTMVVFVGDNGAALFRGKGTLYELGIRVPLIVRWPGVIQPGSVSEELISGEDFAPTMLEAAGQRPLPEMTGRSFLRLLRGESVPGREMVFAERGAHGDPLPSHAACLDFSRVVITRSHKLIYNATWQLPYWPVDFFNQPFWLELAKQNEAGTLDPKWRSFYFAPQRPMFELYDLANDPHELHNLAGKPEAAREEFRLRMALTEWMLTERDYLPLPAPDAPK
ncbi:MAG: sulfatase, partial [Verrucomicrobia subdivision 3 bacterium]|nr:sulfatase [Limisphaerales bacterium]